MLSNSPDVSMLHLLAVFIVGMVINAVLHKVWEKSMTFTIVIGSSLLIILSSFYLSLDVTIGLLILSISYLYYRAVVRTPYSEANR